MTEDNQENKDNGQEDSVKTEEKHTTEVKVDMSGMQNAVITELKNQNEALTKQIGILTEAVGKLQPPVVEIKEVKTKGIVREEAKIDEVVKDGCVIEKADSGRGFQIYKNYDKETCKFKRLVR